MNYLRDFDFIHGKYRATKCEWNCKCTETVLSGKSYCKEHYARSRVPVDEETIEKSVEKTLKVLEKYDCVEVEDIAE